MQDLKEVFGDKQLSYDEFDSALKKTKLKLIDLSTGEYVDKNKFESQINKLQEQLKSKDVELEEAKKLNEGNGSEAEKLQKKLDDFEKQLQEQKASLEESNHNLDVANKREIARKAGVTNDEFVDLTIYKFGNKPIDEFKNEVENYAKKNKNLWETKGNSPDLNSNPDGGGDNDSDLRKSMGLK